MGTVLLAVGYPAAVWALARAVPMFRQRRGRRFLVAETGTASVALGWALRGKAVPSFLNASAAVVLALLWWFTGRRRR
jgi:hypothetical protein